MRLTLLSILLLSGFCLSGQIGQTFPAIKGTTLDEKAFELPFGNEKSTLVAIAFNRKAEDDLKKWLNPIYNTFIKKEKGNSPFDMSELYDVNFAFIPMISGFKRIAEDFKKGTDKQFWPYIVDTEKTDVKALEKTLGVDDTKIPYFFALDKNGKIMKVVSGSYSDDKLEKLVDAMD